MIEQSFSDFGDADVVLLLDHQGEKQVIFIEAKVKTSQKSHRNISDEFKAFKNGLENSKVPKGFSSNLFVQLYLKVRLAKALQTGDIKQLKKGLPFPECLLKTSKKTHKKLLPRKIGDNKVVLKAIDLIKDYCKCPWFVALAPPDNSKADDFYKITLKNYKPDGFQEWDVKNWGYIAWEDVKNFCENNGLNETQKIFSYNEGQIYEL